MANTFLRSGAGVTDPVLSDGAANYTPGISERRGSVSTFQHSGLTNIDTETGTAQGSSGTNTYDAFGGVTATTGVWKGPFGYGGSSGYQSDASGLMLLGHRYYDASIGRFLTRDPAKDGRNWYGYCGNRPTNVLDPTGLALPVAMAPILASPGIGEVIVAVGVGVVVGAALWAVVSAAAEALNGGDDAPADYPPVPCPWPDGVVPEDDAPPPGWHRPNSKGNYTNPEWPEWWLRPDLEHGEPIGPHWDLGPPRKSPLPKVRISPGPWYV